MKILFKSRRFYIFLSLILGVLMVGSVCFSQEKSDEELKKKYALILGEYEFDLSEFGGAVIVLNIHIENGALWGDSGDGNPVTLEPVEDGRFEFTADDPESGALEITFLKDDQGQYTKCHIKLLDMGLEITGNKIKSEANAS